jgi:hypothetical protein
MPVSPLTPLSLTAEVNLHRLRDAFKELEGFYVDPGIWCCRTCATSDAWSQGQNQPYVFWHEQNEDALHQRPTEAMPLYYGVAKKGVSEQEVIDAARTIVQVLRKHDLKSDWNDGEFECPILVQLDEHKPNLEHENESDNDYLDVCLYLPMNEETKEYCWNESDEEFGEPVGTYSFYQRIEDGESLKDAVQKVPPKIRKYITHYLRSFNEGESSTAFPVEGISEIDSEYWASGGISLKESLEQVGPTSITIANSQCASDAKGFRDLVNSIVLEIWGHLWQNQSMEVPTCYTSEEDDGKINFSYPNSCFYTVGDCGKLVSKEYPVENLDLNHFPTLFGVCSTIVNDITGGTKETDVHAATKIVIQVFLKKVNR